ncbi:glycine zipper 2TM domain-containing protein [Sphingomonas sp.]|uniref:glycine zipper 2TM domain-containing protein n=1 Tax=Sphingomonas sp. TaxID=28214 RepID=UPI0035BC3A17
MFTRTLGFVLAAATLATATAPAAAQSPAADARWSQAQARFDRELALYRQEFDRHRSNAQRGGGYADPAYDNGQYRQAPDRYSQQDYDDRDENGYDAARYYRSGPNYQERVLRPEDRVYAGQDGRYYCRRSDGTTGLVLGGAAGGILGNVIDGGHSRIVGTLLGGAVGAIAGKSIDQNQSQVRCR